VWLWRRVDPVLPWPGLSLIAVARKPVRAEGSTEAETGHAQSGVVSRV
jgi:hypothetical protein